jgi:deoxyinosine 3'endonuclease (endonuclease V)
MPTKRKEQVAPEAVLASIGWQHQRRINVQTVMGVTLDDRVVGIAQHDAQGNVTNLVMIGKGSIPEVAKYLVDHG